MLALLIVFSVIGLQVATEKWERCLEDRDYGYSCSNSSAKRMFYYSQSTGVCQPFMYSGCGGTENRFDTAKECRDACKNVQKYANSESSDLTKQMKSACDALYDTDHLNVTKCSNAASCGTGYTCKKKFCCPTADYLCNLQYDTGKFAVGGEKSDKYFYNTDFEVCMRFSFYGTLGNANNFPNYNSCQKTCGSQKNKKNH